MIQVFLGAFLVMIVTGVFHLSGKYMPDIFDGETLSFLLLIVAAMWAGAIFLIKEMDGIEDLEGLSSREQLRARVLMNSLRPKVIVMGLIALLFGIIFYITYSQAFKALVSDDFLPYLPALCGFIYSILVFLSLKLLSWVLQIRAFARVVKQRNKDKANHQSTIGSFI